ncbi:MAG: sortase [Anaerolineaceae bacterium]|nr:sortase [Anaerolineaceae bacterium]MCB9099892.1 sortase [Anaerolineales bacterium]
MNLKDPQFILEQIALVVASMIWTLIILVGIALFWAYQDIQTRWEYVLTAPPEALAQVAEVPPAIPLPAIKVSPTPTPWAGPGPTATPTATKFPTPTATRVVPLPEMLPETLNPDDPVPVVIHTDEELAAIATEQAAPDPVTIDILPTPTSEAAAPTSIPTLLPPTATPAPPPVVEQPVVDAPANLPTGSGIPDHLNIPSVGIDANVIPVGWNVVQKDGREYSIWQVADYAVGWHKTTALLGHPGNTVMAGHHNVNGEVFRDLVNVEVGDKIIVSSNGQTFNYVVEMKTIVKEKGEPPEVRRKNAQWIAPTDDERLTFVTCWPYTNNTHRVIVVAKPA